MLMFGSSKHNRESYPRKYFWTQEKETRITFNPGLSANPPSMYSKYSFKGLREVMISQKEIIPLGRLIRKNKMKNVDLSK